MSKKYADHILYNLNNSNIFDILNAENDALKGHDIKNPTKEDLWVFDAVKVISKIVSLIDSNRMSGETIDITIKNLINRYPPFAVDKMSAFLVSYLWNSKSQRSKNLSKYLINKFVRFAKGNNA